MASYVTFGGSRGANDRKDAGCAAYSSLKGENMTKRGKVLRDTTAGPGLLAIDGQHFQFTLDGVWRAATPPAVGMVVTVEFAEGGRIASINSISESQIAKEQAEEVVKAAGKKGKELASVALARFGPPTLIATGLLILGWFFLSAVSIQTFLGKMDLTWWQLLGFLNSGSAFESAMQGRPGPSAGFYGFLAIIALAGPLVPYFWKDKRAGLGGLLPLLFMLMVGAMLRSSINSSLVGDVNGPLGDVARQMHEEAMKAVSIGLGIYLSALVSLYFAGMGVKKFLLARGLDAHATSGSSQVAA